MSSKTFDSFCDQVCASIRWPPAQRLAREELTAHLEDHAAALEENVRKLRAIEHRSMETAARLLGKEVQGC